MAFVPVKTGLGGEEMNLTDSVAQGQNKPATKMTKQSDEARKSNKRSSEVMAQDSGDGEESTDPSKADSASKKPKADKNHVPTCWAEVSSSDRLLINMKEAGKPWKEINEAYINFIGHSVEPSTPRNRYLNIKASLAQWKDGDKERMLVAYQQVCDQMQDGVVAHPKRAIKMDIWEKIAQAMVGLGAGVYPPRVVKRAFQNEKRRGFPHSATIDAVLARSTMGGNVMGGYENGGYENGGYENGGYENGGYENGGYENGGYENGGYENGGYENGGYENGGYGNGGCQNGGYENGGHENGGYGNGGCQNGGYENGGYMSGSPMTGGNMAKGTMAGGPAMGYDTPTGDPATGYGDIVGHPMSDGAMMGRLMMGDLTSDSYTGGGQMMGNTTSDRLFM